MHISNVRLLFFIFFLFYASTVWCAEPTLARLSFWVAPERMTEMEDIYQRILMPLLQKQGLKPTSQSGRLGSEGIFSRLQETQSPTDVRRIQSALNEDQAWQRAMVQLGRQFGTHSKDGHIQWSFMPYATSAGTSRSTSTAEGHGFWRNFN